MKTRPRFYYADCYDKMAINGTAVYGVCTGKIKSDDVIYICMDCVKCPYWVYSGAKPEAGYGKL